MLRKKRPKHPMQPVIIANDKVIRFNQNSIVRWMLDELRRHGRDLNYIAAAFRIHEDHKDDYQQLMQLIGYSVSGYGDLSTHDRDVLRSANAEATKLLKRRHR